MTLFKKLRAYALSLAASALLALVPVSLTSVPAYAFKISAAVGGSMLNTMKALPNSGTLVIYSGTEPTNPDTALSGNTALATFTFSSTAYGSNSSSGGFQVTTASFSSSTVTASASGTATFARMFETGGTTVDADFTIGTSGSDINLNSTSITSGGNVTLTSVQLKMPID